MAQLFFVQKQDLTPAESAKAQQQLSFFNLKAVLIGALRSDKIFYPVVLSGKSLKILRTGKHLSNQKLAIEYLESSLKKINLLPKLGQSYEFIQKDNYWAVIREFYENNLTQAIKSKALSEAEKGNILKAIILEVEQLHKQGLSHGHLCLNNIMLGKDKQPIICDFGIGFFLSDKRDTFAPEASKLLTPEKYNDLFGLGLLIQDLFPNGTDLLPAHIQRDLLSPNKEKRPGTALLLELFKNSAPQAKAKPTKASIKIPKINFNNKSNVLFIIAIAAILIIGSATYLNIAKDADSSTATSAASSSSKALTDLLQEKLSDSENKTKIIAAAEELLSQEFNPQNIALLLNSANNEKDGLLLLKILVGFYSDDLEKLKKIAELLPQIKQIQKFYDWFSLNPLADWSKENPLIKLLIIAGEVSQNLANPDLYLDLLYYPQSESAIKAAGLAVKRKPEIKSLLEAVISDSSISRIPGMSLLFACGLEKKQQRPLISKWFDYKPTAKTVLGLLFALNNQKQYELFNFFASRYLKTLELNPSDDEIKKMLWHSEDQLRILAINEISTKRKKLIPELNIALSRESNPKIAEALKLILDAQ